MRGILVAPDLHRSNVIVADWLELVALARPSQYATLSDILDSHDFLEDRDAPPPQGGEIVPQEDPDILDQSSEAVFDAISDELSFRSKVLKDAYPFRLSSKTSPLKLDVAELADDDFVKQGRDINIACLYMSAIRAGLLNAKACDLKSDPDIGNLFQICATIAAAGYVHGDAYWFGHPRPDRPGILDAVKTLADHLGQGIVAHQVPVGESRYVKDGGIDVVAWRSHHDGRPAKLILYGQCASGVNWEGKSVVAKVNRMDGYYTMSPSKHWLPALLTPFPLYMDKENSHSLSNEEAIHGFYLRNEAVMGVIIDRLRIVLWCIEGLRNPQPSMKTAVDKLGDLFKWEREAA
ncbi:MAG: hypothetical protein OXC26_06420 [Albidovulum sp.]|nr:hypothetical protein [Albidovulum sp.]